MNGQAAFQSVVCRRSMGKGEAKVALSLSLPLLALTLFWLSACAEGNSGDNYYESCSMLAPPVKLKSFSFDFEGQREDRVVLEEAVVKDCSVEGYREVNGGYTAVALPVSLHKGAGASGLHADFTVDSGDPPNLANSSVIYLQEPVEGIYSSGTTDIASDFTLLMWVRPTAVAGLIFYSSRYSDAPFFYLTQAPEARLRLTSANPERPFGFESVEAFSADAWQHIAVTFDYEEKRAAFFRNGVELAVPKSIGATRPDLTWDPGPSDEGLGIGIGGSFSGSMDKVTFINQQLAAEQIGSLFEQERGEYLQ